MIKFVFFDVGGVVIKDFSSTNKWAELMKEMGVGNEKEEEFNSFWKTYESDICLGFDVEKMVPLISEHFKVNIRKDYSLLEGFVKRFELNSSIWPAIEAVKKTCGIGLLTNMYPNMLDAIRNKGLLPDIKWDKIVDSSKVHFKKPDKEVFQYAEKVSGFKGREILFIDNGQVHVDGAKNFGWQTYFYDTKNYSESSKNLMKWFQENYSL